MNPFKSGAALGILAMTAVGFALAATERQHSEQPAVALTAAEAPAGSDDTCPYPPRTPAAQGAEALPRIYIMPVERPARGPLRNAVYMESLDAFEQAKKAKLII